MTATILYATDLGYSGDRPRQLACLLAKGLKARLFLVHAADAGDEINPVDVPPSVRPPQKPW